MEFLKERLRHLQKNQEKRNSKETMTAAICPRCGEPVFGGESSFSYDHACGQLEKFLSGYPSNFFPSIREIFKEAKEIWRNSKQRKDKQELSPLTVELDYDESIDFEDKFREFRRDIRDSLKEHPAYREEDLEIKNERELEEAKKEAGVTSKAESALRASEANTSDINLGKESFDFKEQNNYGALVKDYEQAYKALENLAKKAVKNGFFSFAREIYNKIGNESMVKKIEDEQKQQERRGSLDW